MSDIENRVAARIIERAATGLAKYGVTVERTDLTTLEWLQHAQDEAMDTAVYIERLKQEFTMPESQRVSLRKLAERLRRREASELTASCVVSTEDLDLAAGLIEKMAR